MASVRRLFVSAASQLTSLQQLSAEEAHYARDVLRLRDGAAVCLLDGRGHEAPAIVQLEGRRGPVHVRIEGPWARNVGLDVGAPLTLLVPLPKGDRADWMVEKLAELGCVGIVFLDCAHSASNAAGPGGPKRLERLARLAQAAARQARHGRIPAGVGENPLPIAEALAAYGPQGRAHTAAWVADLGAHLPSFTEALAAARAGQAPGAVPMQHVMLLGPEGGLTEDELNQARGFGYTPVGLGPHVLRVETAAMAAAAVAAQAGERTLPTAKA